MRYLGNEVTTSRSQVIRYLTENYTDASGKPVTEADAKAACEAHKDEINRAISPFMSNVYYPGDKISAAMGWTELPDPAEEDEDYDDNE
jgi:hypothetical protein